METDLSSVHHRITKLFAESFGPDPLTAEQVEFFHENGYLSGVDVLNSTEIEALRDDLAEMIAGKYAGDPLFYEYNRNESGSEGDTLFHALGGWRVSPVFHDLVFHPLLAAAFAQLLGGPARFWHDQVFVKPAGHGGIVAWHQDYSYWTRTKPMAHLTAWIGLDDSNEANGCVHYVPGSHRWDLLPRGSLANDMDAVLEILTEEQKREFKPVASVLRAGQASFHHPLMLHGSFENRSDRPRRAAVINVFRDGVVSDSDDPPLEGVPAVPKGEKMNGRFFPLLTSRIR